MRILVETPTAFCTFRNVASFIDENNNYLIVHEDDTERTLSYDSVVSITIFAK